MQRSKGNGLAGAFGGVGAGEAMFGARGVTTVLHKATIYLAIAFMVSSLSLVVATTQRSGGNNSAGPARATGGVVLPVGGADVAAPDAPSTTTAPGATDDVVPTESADDSIVPAAEAEESDPDPGEQTGDEGEGSEGTQNEGGR
jgi:preprotein translocase subunit SecG